MIALGMASLRNNCHNNGSFGASRNLFLNKTILIGTSLLKLILLMGAYDLYWTLLDSPVVNPNVKRFDCAQILYFGDDTSNEHYFFRGVDLVYQEKPLNILKNSKTVWVSGRAFTSKVYAD